MPDSAIGPKSYEAARSREPPYARLAHVGDGEAGVNCVPVICWAGAGRATRFNQSHFPFVGADALGKPPKKLQARDGASPSH